MRHIKGPLGRSNKHRFIYIKIRDGSNADYIRLEAGWLRVFLRPKALGKLGKDDEHETRAGRLRSRGTRGLHTRRS